MSLLAAADKIIAKLAERSETNGRKGRPIRPATMAAALGLMRKEFTSEDEAKQHFGVPRGTGLRVVQEKLDELHASCPWAIDEAFGGMELAPQHSTEHGCNSGAQQGATHSSAKRARPAPMHRRRGPLV